MPGKRCQPPNLGNLRNSPLSIFTRFGGWHLFREAEKAAGVGRADVGYELVEPVAAVGQAAGGHVAADEVAENAAEVLVSRIREKRP
jgi:hypothetical protein